MKLTKSHAEAVAASGVWKKKFALLPTFMSDGSLIWLETYEVRTDFITNQIASFWRTTWRRINKEELLK